ncbi:hypothetical protein, variant [Aphanomyces astaci]|uniref:Uncharacterized protein n=1 Tax=Aphanomyces astaci TaxID=112090 RepID=W4GT40_APHAT|nr:hypothetical protein, variant [Aphanomyces astaci]ETV82877.1 hypothetical protein, variant [Aphanomyces astaci]|eukprot:XP_009827548.1 hypothetical protein, variant [Aphanomyces astaci]
MDNQIEEMAYEGLDGTFTSTTPRHGCVPPPLDKFPDDNLDNLRLQLDEVEQELRQAAEYGLHLVATNNDLTQSMQRIQIAHETTTSELKGDIAMLERHLLAMEAERDAWKQKCHTAEESLDRLQQEQPSPNQPHCYGDTSTSEVHLSRVPQDEVDRLKASVYDLSTALEQATASAIAKDLAIHRLQSTKRDMLDIIQQMKCAAANDASARKALAAKNTTLHGQLATALVKMDACHEMYQVRLADEARLRQTIEELTVELQAQGDDVEAKSNLVHSTRLKCSHLERQLESLVGRETDLEGGGQSSHDPNEDEATSEALASFDRLESFFKLTALGIILDHGAHDKFLQGSSRHTIQAWFRQATQADVPYHQWHRWLTIRIAGYDLKSALLTLVGYNMAVDRR